jgi:alkylation response protein AidB-like acyl-CoA dehydrogenase
MNKLGREAVVETVVDRVTALVPQMQRNAKEADDMAAFPSEDIAALRDAGVFAMLLPIEQNPCGDDGGAAIDQLAGVLMRLGMGNLAVGRIVEAHINARHLIARYGSPDQKTRAVAQARAGHLFALWVTDPAGANLRMIRTRDGFRLDGGKMFCSAAGFATQALVTAVDDAGHSRMMVIALGNGERVRPLEAPLQGMRAAVTGAVDFSGCTADRDACLGEPGDYLREPDFSAGAWRGSAVAAGGLRSLIDMATAQLRTAGRLDNQHQLQRLGNALIAWETSRLWVRQVALIAEDRNADPARTVAYAGLARIAVEAACLDAMRLVQRSLGLSAFRRGNPVERVCRDLATYLRQPAPDEVLTEAAAHFANQPMPDSV